MTKEQTEDKSRAISLKDVPGKTRDRVLTDMVAQGVAMNASAAVRFIGSGIPGLSLTDMVESLKEQGEAVNRGDLSEAERMLHSQAVALNAIFGELARRAAENMGDHLPATELYLRLALRAQSQSRATIETLAVIKNPPVFARQANIAHGPQQVNNGPAPDSPPASARPGETVSTPTELLEDRTHGRTQLDTRAAQAASRAHPRLEPVEAIDGTAHC